MYTSLLDPSILPKLAPILFYFGTCAATLCIGIALQRALVTNLPPSIYLISAIVMAVSTTFFYTILWLTVTLLSPTENHFAPILIALIVTGYIPATILGVMGYKPNRQTKETQNEIENNNEIINDRHGS